VDQLLDKYDAYFAEATLKPSDGGRFEVTVDDTKVFSKLAEDRFPGDEELLTLVGKQIGAET
jgi:selT/selW/selH-like putative selenoprotein